jgi:hypothetical protein
MQLLLLLLLLGRPLRACGRGARLCHAQRGLGQIAGQGLQRRHKQRAQINLLEERHDHNSDDIFLSVFFFFFSSHGTNRDGCRELGVFGSLVQVLKTQKYLLCLGIIGLDNPSWRVSSQKLIVRKSLYLLFYLIFHLEAEELNVGGQFGADGRELRVEVCRAGASQRRRRHKHGRADPHRLPTEE